MILEVYQKYAQQNNYQYKDPNNPNGDYIPMVNLTDEKFALYHFTYIRGLQDFVVTGVKHNDTGSADFEVLFLKNIAQENNLTQVRKILSQNLELDARSISDIIRIVTWAEITGIRKACSMFLKMYNKGTLPSSDADKNILETHQDYIQQNTYFGELLKPIFDVVNESRQRKLVLEKQFQADLDILIQNLSKSD